MLKFALDKNLITPADFLKEDDEVIKILHSSNDKQIVSLLKKLHPNVKVRVDTTDFDIHRKNKMRLIDPSICLDNKLVSASNVSDLVKNLGAAAYEKSKIGSFVKVVSS